MPETVTKEPTAPEVGLRVIPGMRVKVVDAEWENASVTVTLCVPAMATGAMNDALKAPAALVVEVPMVVESNVTVTSAEPAKPVPVTMNDEPEVPFDGLSVVEAITVKVEDAECEEESMPTTEWAPFVELGIVNAALKDPVAEVVIVRGEVVIVVPSYLIVIVEEAA